MPGIKSITNTNSFKTHTIRKITGTTSSTVYVGRDQSTQRMNELAQVVKQGLKPRQSDSRVHALNVMLSFIII